MDKEKLKARNREEIGSAASRRLRRAGELPAVLAGAGKEAMPVAVSTHDFEFLQQGGTRVVTLDFGAQKVEALIREVQYDPMGENVIHVDFDRTVAGQTVEVEVRIEFFGEPVGVAAGGVFQARIDTVTVTCLPGAIPESLEVDVRELEIGGEVRVSDLDVPEGVEMDLAPEEILAVVALPELIEEEEEAEEVEVAPEGEEGEPEVIGKKKEQEEEEKD
jgi:large subunit ribosomal protein L25